MKKNLTKQEIYAYAAGVFDGEGSISIQKTVNLNDRYNLRIHKKGTNENIQGRHNGSDGGISKKKEHGIPR